MEALTNPTPTLHCMSPAKKRCLIAIDAPNLDRALARVLGRRAGPSDRPEFTALFSLASAQEAQAEAVVFATVRPENAAKQAAWIRHLGRSGFSVFAKPVSAPGVDIDLELVAFVETALPGDSVIVLSHDARLLGARLEALAAGGVDITVIGFREWAGCLICTPGVMFTDASDVPGLYANLPRRVDLRSLPPEGHWFHPHGADDALNEAAV